jgi:hypothetical protein
VSRKFDYYAYRKHNHIPVSLQPHYFAIHAFFLEVLRSREISKEISICQTRLAWWRGTVDDILTKPDLKPREPLAVMLKNLQ